VFTALNLDPWMNVSMIPSGAMPSPPDDGLSRPRSVMADAAGFIADEDDRALAERFEPQALGAGRCLHTGLKA
jgi:hypothetical protein